MTHRHGDPTARWGLTFFISYVLFDVAPMGLTSFVSGFYSMPHRHGDPSALRGYFLCYESLSRLLGTGLRNKENAEILSEPGI